MTPKKRKKISVSLQSVRGSDPRRYRYGPYTIESLVTGRSSGPYKVMREEHPDQFFQTLDEVRDFISARVAKWLAKSRQALAQE